MRAERAAKSEKKSSKKDKKVEGNKKEANKKEHCLSASRVFDSAQDIKGGKCLNEQKVQCRLCEQYFNDEDMSDEHYPAHSVGNDDIIELDLTKFMDTLMGDNPELKEAISAATKNGEDPKECADKYFDQHLAKDLYPKGRTARTLCRKCNTFLGKYDEAYKKFYSEDGDPKKVKGFQKQTKIQIVKAIFAKFLSIPEAQDIHFDFLDFICNPEEMEYHGAWKLYFIKRVLVTKLIATRTFKLNCIHN